MALRIDTSFTEDKFALNFSTIGKFSGPAPESEATNARAAGTQLEAGDAAIISYQEDGDTTWAIVLLTDIIAGTEISFTDNGWRASGGFNPSESEGLTFTAGSGLAAGTVVIFKENGPGFDATLVDGVTSAGTVTGDRLGLSSAGDQIIMYQGGFDTVTGDLDPDAQLISAYHANGAWDADAVDSNTSALPPELIDYSVDQSVLGEQDNAVYVGPISGSAGQIWTFIQNQANWVGGGSATSPPYGPGFAGLTDFMVDNTNSLPTITVPADFVFEVDSTDNLITGLSVGDVDNDRLTVMLTVEGDLTLAQTTGLNFLAGDGTADATMTFSGRIADINAALDGILYAPAAGDDDGDTISISVTDGSATITQGSFPASVDLDMLDGTNGFLIEGLVERDQLGYTVANAGDVNGDGIDDLIVGAPYAENGALVSAGKAYVIYGTDTGFASSFDLSTLDGTNGFELTTGVAGDELGHSVSGIGDVNGDGVDDFAIGSFKAHVGAAADAGKAWIVFGDASGFPAQVNVDTLDGSDGFVFNGVNADDYAGRVVSAAGDINGDGIDDILVSGDRTDPNGVQQSGATYVIYGSNAGFSASLSAGDIDGTNGSLIAGEEAASQTGRMVKAAGDVNGDGFDDLVIGAYKATADGDAQAGKTYVVFGGSGGLGAQLDLSTLDGTNGFSVDGIAAGDQSGRGVSSAGDINGDGFDDILIGAPESGSGGASSGGAYVVFGSGAGFAANIDLASLDGTNGFAITGEGPSKRTGFDVSELGDINGDGIDDILLGGRASSGVEGKSYVVFGSATGFGASFDLGSLDGSNGFELPEVVFGDRVGFSVSSAGDVNDDGINDLVIGANGADPAGANAGEVYVVFGNANISQNFITDSVAISHVYAPVIANLDGDMVTHTEGDLLTLLDAGGDLLVSDTDSADFDGGRLSVSFTGFQAATDGLAIDTSGAVALSAGQVAGSDVSVNGTVIGTIAAGETGASNEGLAIDLNGDATPIAVQALLAAIGYTNGGGDTPDETTRTFDVALTDGDGGGTTVSTSVDVVAVDDAPLLAVPAGQSFAVNSAGNVISGVSVDDVDTASVEVTVSAEGAVTLAQTSGLTFTAGADGTSSMTFSGSLTDVNAALATLGYAPASDDRDGDSLSVTVDDGTTPVTDSIAIALTNTDPQANDDALGVGEDGPALAGSLFDDNGNGADGDANGDLLTVSAVDGEGGDVAQPLTLASGALLTVNSDGTFTYDPNGAFETLDETETATEAFTYTVDDGFGGSDTATATVTIAGANDVSQLTLPAAQSFAVNSTGNTIAGLAVSDVDDATVTVTLTAEGAVTLASVTGLSFSDGADGSSSMTFSGLLADVNTAIATLGYTPANGDRDGDSVAITIDDGTDTTTGNIGVTLTNTDPVAGDDAFGLVESASLVGGDLFADNGSGIDDDANGDMLTVTAVNGETADVGVQLLLASGALLTVNANGTYDYDTNGAFDSLASGETASETFTYTVDDGFGGSDTATVTLTINGENDAPLANDDALAVSEDGPVLSGDVFADNGNGADTDPNGDDISIVSVNGQAGDVGQPILLASGALLTLNTDGTFSYDTNGAFEALDTGELATDSFTYTVQDTFGATGSATATVTIDGVNDTPTVTVPDAQAFLANSAGHTLTGFAVDDADDATLLVTLSADGALTLAQDSGLIFTLGDGDADSAMAFTGTLADINAALSSLVYSPATGDRDGDSINLTAFDFDATASDSVTVDLQNADPVTTDDAFTLGDTGPAVSGNLFADNGNGSDSDANGDLLSVGAVNGASVNVGVPLLLASGALVTVNSDGTFTYDPNGAFDFLAEGFTGQDSFTYTAEDGFGGSATSTVNLTLTGSQDGDDVAILTGLDDTLSGGVGNDDINGSAGNDTLYGDEGDDRLVGAAGADVLHGGEGSDFLGGGNGNDELFGGAGNDELQGSSGDDRVIGQAGDDVLYGDVGNDFLGGGNGNDELYGGDGDDTLQGAAGNDRVIGQNGNDTAFGGDGDDFVRGAAGDDILHGDLGDDELRGDNGDDQLFGGAGNDDLFGGADNDLLQGADGDDTLSGDSGDDTLLGGSGNDFLGGGAGNDVIDGEDGNDDLRGALGNDELDGGAGDDILYGNEGDDVLGGGNGNDQLFGGSGADQMQGSEGDDLLGGGAGSDTLLGGVGNDDLRGGGGDDVLAGQEGDDVLLGDTGTDTFVFAFAEPGNDTVLDFEAGETVRLDGFAYATAAEAAEDFAQVGNDVVFTLGNQTATFKNVDLADVVAGIELSGGATTRVAAPPADDGLALKAFDQFDFGGVAGADDINELDVFPDLMTGAPASSRELMPATAEDALVVDTLLDGDVEDAFVSLDFDWMS